MGEQTSSQSRQLSVGFRGPALLETVEITVDGRVMSIADWVTAVEARLAGLRAGIDKAPKV